MKDINPTTGSAASIININGMAGDNNGGNSSAKSDSPGFISNGAAGVYFFTDAAGLRAYDSTTATVSTIWNCGRVYSGYAAGQSLAGQASGTTGGTARCDRLSGIVKTSTMYFMTDVNAHTVRAMDASLLTYIAGGTLTDVTSGFADGNPGTSLFNAPNGVDVDSLSTPTKLYVADTNNHAIRVVDVTGLTFPTTTLVGGYAGSYDGQLSVAQLSYPRDVKFFNNKLYVIDRSGLRLIDLTTSVLSSIAANNAYIGINVAINGIGSAAVIFKPLALVLDASAANAYITDSTNLVRKVVIATGAVTTVTGGGSARTVNAHGNDYDDGGLHMIMSMPITTLSEPTSGSVTCDDASESGIAFTVSTDVMLAGVRINRRESATNVPIGVRLWASGSKMASGEMVTPTIGHYDIRFTAPVLITAGVTYVVSCNSTCPGVIHDALTTNAYTSGIFTIPINGGRTGTANTFPAASNAHHTLVYPFISAPAAPFSTGTGVDSLLSEPKAMVTSPDGLYIYFTEAYFVKRLTIATGAIITLAGYGVDGFADGTGYAAR